LSQPHALPSPPSSGAGPGRSQRSCERAELSLTGRYLRGQSDDRPLLTSNISCDGAFILCQSPPDCGEQIICYFDDLGRVAAEVIQLAPGGFAVRFLTSALKRDRLADRLTRLVNNDPVGVAEDRAAVRVPASGHAVVILSDGTELPCRLTDISVTGAAFEALGRPPFVGDRVRAGNLPAEVVRVTGRKFAVRYLRGAEASAG
jgi:hypothetical protein